MREVRPHYKNLTSLKISFQTSEGRIISCRVLRLTLLIFYGPWHDVQPIRDDR